MTDMVLFRYATDLNAGERVYGWVGPWPPPERMTIVTGPSGGNAVCESDNPDLATVPAEWLREDFVLASASPMPEPAPPGAHWVRGAEYLPVG